MGYPVGLITQPRHQTQFTIYYKLHKQHSEKIKVKPGDKL